MGLVSWGWGYNVRDDMVSELWSYGAATELGG